MKVRQISREGNWRVFATCTDRGDCQLEDFLAELDSGMRGYVDGMYAILYRVASHGPRLHTELAHHLRDDIWEFIKGRIRVLYFCDRDRVVVCTHALVKASKKVPRADIEHALSIMRSYRNAVANGTLQILREEHND